MISEIAIEVINDKISHIKMEIDLIDSSCTTDAMPRWDAQRVFELTAQVELLEHIKEEILTKEESLLDEWESETDS